MSKKLMLFALAMVVGGLFAAPIMAITVPPMSSLPLISTAEVSGPLLVTSVADNSAPAFGRAFRMQQSGVGADWITIRIYNGTGTTADLNLQPPTLSAGDTAEFALDSSSLNITGISPGAYSDFRVQFSPTSTGSKTAVVSVSYETDPLANPGSYTSFLINVSGTAVAGPPSHLVFRHDISTGPELWSGQLGLGERNFAPRVVTAGPSAGIDIWIINEGFGAVTVAVVPLTGNSAFTLDTSNFNPTLAMGQSTYVTVAFDPQVAGTNNEFVIFTHNDSTLGSPFQVEARGTGIDLPTRLRVTDQAGQLFSSTPGIQGAPAAYIGGHIDNNSAAIDLGDVALGNSTPITITVSHGGQGYLDMLNFTYVAGPDLALGTPASASSEFAVNTSGFLNTLGEESSTSFTVTFTPSALGAFNGSVTFTHDDGSEVTPYTLNFTGNGVVSGGGSSTGGSNGSAGCASSDNSDIMLLIVLSLLVAIGVFRLRHRA